MATTGVVNSTLFAIYLLESATYEKVANLTDASFSFSHEPRDITTKDSGGYRELLEGLRSWSASGSGLVQYDTGSGEQGYAELYAASKDRTLVTCRFMTNVTGDTYYQGTAYVTSVEKTSPGAEDNVTFTISLEGTGAITTGTIS
jgi:TP901-1 family phage major tail protein